MNTANKVKTLVEVIGLARAAKAAGKKIVTTNGCFDLLHVGHIAILEWAKAQGDLLIVGVNSDGSVRLLKGAQRPILPAVGRMRVLAGLAATDYIFTFEGESPIPWIRAIAPDIQVKSSDTVARPAFRLEEEAVMAGGGRVVVMPKVEGASTTEIIEDIVLNYRQGN